jgi:hypothetical protein
MATDTEKKRDEMKADLWEAVALIREVADHVAPLPKLESAARLVWSVKQRLDADDESEATNVGFPRPAIMVGLDGRPVGD